MILQAYSGADLDNTENQKTAITQLLTDLMHYCEVMSLGKPEKHPDHIDFADIIDKAYEDYWVQADTMKGPLEAEAKRTGALVEQRLAEMRTADQEKTAAEDLTDPKLQAILQHLRERQDKEAEKLAGQQEQALHIYGTDPELLEEHEHQTERQHQGFEAERNRYIHDYKAAKTLASVEEEQDRREAPEHGIDPDEPNLTQ